MRFIATADWQIGMTASYLTEDARPRFRQARLEAVRAIGNLARERDAQFVLVCGDVFESNQLDRTVVARAFEALKDVPVPVYLLPGNHDPMDASSLYRSAEFEHGCPTHVHVLSETGPWPVASGVEIVAAPWFSKHPVSDLVADACHGLGARVDGVVRVVAGHGTTRELNPDRDDVAAVDTAALRGVLDDGRADFVVLGDRHSTTRVDDRIWYPGAPEVTDRDEVDPGNVLVVDIEEGPRVPEVTPVHVGRWAFVDHAQQLTGPADVRALDEWLEKQVAKERTAVWLRLSGTLTVHDKAALDDILAHHELLFAALALWQRHYDLCVLPDDADFSDLGLTGFAEDAVAELVGVAGAGGEDAPAAQDALGLLYRLTGGGGR